MGMQVLLTSETRRRFWNSVQTGIFKVQCSEPFALYSRATRARSKPTSTFQQEPSPRMVRARPVLPEQLSSRALAQGEENPSRK